jgi:small subunit ribosomal protein S1
MILSESYSESDLPFPDESWWDSVLSDDENLSDNTRRSVKEETKKSNPRIDWERGLQLYREDGIVTLSVTGYNRGGLLVQGEDLGGFVPCSHLVNLPVLIDEECREDFFSSFIGRKIKLKIIECRPDEDRLVFSERAACAAVGKRTEIFTSLQPNQRVTGEVTNVTDFGVFVDLGGVEGLIHISELSWGRVTHPAQVLQIGQKIEVIVLEVAPERCRIALSLKRISTNPWATAEMDYPVNSTYPAIISAIVPFGAFARLEEGLEGLIHSSEIPIGPEVSISSVLAPGQAVQVRVLQVEASRQRLSLSLKLE